MAWDNAGGTSPGAGSWPSQRAHAGTALTSAPGTGQALGGISSDSGSNGKGGGGWRVGGDRALHSGLNEAEQELLTSGVDVDRTLDRTSR